MTWVVKADETNKKKDENEVQTLTDEVWMCPENNQMFWNIYKIRNSIGT